MTFSARHRAVHPEDLPELVEYSRARLSSGASRDAEARLRRFDGAYRWFEFRFSPELIPPVGSLNGAGYSIAISKTKKSELALQRSEEVLRTPKSSAKQAVFSGGLSSSGIRVSNELYRILRLPADTPVTLERMTTRNTAYTFG